MSQAATKSSSTQTKAEPMPAKPRTKDLKLKSAMRDVPLSRMKVSEVAQRDLNRSRVDALATEFDPELLGYPVLSERGGAFFIVDGQHRIEALKKWLGDWEKQSITCRVYTGLNEAQEAELFDRLDNILTVNAYQKFKVRVTAGRPDETAVKKCVEKVGLHISYNDNNEGSVMAVATLLKVYKRSDAQVLTRTLSVVSNAFGQPGMTATVIDGVSRVIERYNGQINDDQAVERLAGVRGGVGAVVAKASTLHKQTGIGKSECVAATIVDALNSKAGSKKLPSWWKR